MDLQPLYDAVVKELKIDPELPAVDAPEVEVREGSSNRGRARKAR